MRVIHQFSICMGRCNSRPECGGWQLCSVAWPWARGAQRLLPVSYSRILRFGSRVFLQFHASLTLLVGSTAFGVCT